MGEYDHRTTRTSGVLGLRPLATLFGIGICSIVAALIGLGGIEAEAVRALKHVQPFLERGEPVPCRVLSRSADEPVTYVVEYRLDFENEARRARILGAPAVAGLEVSADVPDGAPEHASLLYDPLNPADVVFADALEPQVDAAVAHLKPWKPVAWIALVVGVLLSAFTFLPMKRLASALGVPLVHFQDDPDCGAPVRPAAYGKYAGIVGTLGGLLTVVVCALLYVGKGRIERLAQHGVPVRGMVVESFIDPRATQGSFRFKIRYTPDEGGPTIERATQVLAGIRAQRFEVGEGETRAVGLIYDPRAPEYARFALPLKWKLAHARTAKMDAAVVLAFALALTVAAVLLWSRCRRILIDDPEEPRRTHRAHSAR